MKKAKLTPLLLMRAKDQSLQKYCTPVMLDRFVCSLLNFCAREFPAKSENQEPGKIIVLRTLYVNDFLHLANDADMLKLNHVY